MLKLAPPLKNRTRADLRRREKAVCGEDRIWSPQSGPQSAAYASEADIIGYGGAAGGGKTDLALGFAATKHRRSIIFRRVFPSLRGIIERSREVYGGFGTLNETTHLWRFGDGRTVELGAVQREADQQKHQGQPRDFYAFDEVTEFPESVVRFLIGWNRTTVPGQECRVLLTFNPPMNEAGDWVTRFFAPWLDLEHPHPAANGELRWFAMLDGQEVERPDGMPFDHTRKDGTIETITPKSRTFFKALLRDNPILEATGYASTIDSMPEPIRSRLKGDFNAGRTADPWQLIPADWVRAAQARWRAMPPPSPNAVPTMSGLDVAHGGPDKTVLARRYDAYVASLDVWPGVATPTGMAAAQLAAARLPADSRLNVDAIGYGASAAERLADAPPAGFGMKARPVNVAERSDYRDKSRRFRMINLRAEMYWRLREALDPEGPDPMALPPDQELLSDLCAPQYEITTSGIKVESKPDLAVRLGRSPDKGDAVALTMLAPKVLRFF